MKFNILLIESNFLMRVFLKNYLERTFNVLSYESADKALENLSKEQIPDLILKSFDVEKANDVSTLRNNMFLRKLPIIMLTKEDKSDQRVAAFKMHATDCLSKPFNPQELVERIHRVVGGVQTQLRELAS